MDKSYYGKDIYDNRSKYHRKYSRSEIIIDIRPKDEYTVLEAKENLCEFLS